MTSKMYRYILSACLVPLSLGVMPAQAQSIDLNDFIPPVQGGNTNVQGAVVDGETIHADTMQDGMNYANDMIEDDGGIRIVSTKTGLGTISSASSSYTIYENSNATLLSKRAAYAEAYMEAKKQLIANILPLQNTCSNVIESNLVAIDSGVSGAANTSRNSNEICGETVSGMLAAYVVYDVNDNVNDREVSISIATSTKTRNAFLRLNPAVISTTDPNAAFSHVMNEIMNYATPPMGAKLITHPQTGEQIVIGFGSSIIRKNSNSTVAKKLKKLSRDQSGMRARNALIAFLRGDDVYWQGGFDESQIEQVEQFTIPVDDQGNYGDPEVYDQERQSFLNTIKMNNSYQSIAGGQLPEGVQTKGFISADGNWYFSIAVYSQSAQAIAQGIAIENNNAINAIDKAPLAPSISSSNNSSTMTMDGGVSDNGVNPQGPSGQVSDSNDF